MKFRTEISFPPPDFGIIHRDKILLAGSCFTEHLGGFLRRHWFDALVNPFGTLYHPLAVYRILERSVQKAYFTRDELFAHENLWKSFDLPSVFNRPTPEEYTEHANRMLDHVAAFLREAAVVFLTYGTARLWIHQSSNRPVANCHKLPPAVFRQHLSGTDELEEVLNKTVRLLTDFNPALRVVFTVSPVRYLQDGFISNTRSKARLLEAVFRTGDSFSSVVYYFPAYEIFMDDLRDYRFYDTDLKHPGPQGIAYVSELFDRYFFHDHTRRLNKEIDKWRRRMLHRPLNKRSNAGEEEKNLKRQIDEFLSKHPFLKPDLND